ncbi:MAG: amino acid adenylation domain-containing protein [Akkermansiaceae bacterium]|nr:amino acid adenylation domain-containing protein [Akkermansiaceae bacterium]
MRRACVAMTERASGTMAGIDAGGGEPLLLHEYFERAAQRWPDQVAVDVPPGAGRGERVVVTYAALSRQAKTLARRLQPCVTGECVVGILLPRNSGLLYAAQLAVLQTGAAYTCLDPQFPDERVRDVLEDSEAVAVLTDAAGLVRVKAVAPGLARVIDAGAVLAEVEPPPEPAFRPPWLSPGALAYVIYTSGTTGRPKGVLIEHRSIANLVHGDLAEFHLGPGDRLGQGSSAAYDSSVEETWLAFAAGATVVVMDDDTARLGPDLIPWLRCERITVFCPPPTLLRATGCDDPAMALPELKLLYVGGEALPRDVADRWARGRRLVNGYGPTECTVTSLRGDVEEGGPITIGQPVPGLAAWVLDEALREVPAGDRGELCLGGIGLARGYWKSPALTEEKFVTHPALGRLYRTGDLVHCDGSGSYHYHGRMDSQVKIRGYRIELAGIEAHLAGCAGVRAAACHVQDVAANPILVAFIVPENPAAPPAAAGLKSSLEANLPSYMVPARFGYLSEFPTTVGGKLNRAALPHLDGGEREAVGPLVSPRNAMEHLLEAAFRDSLGQPQPISIHSDFFKDLGGDSLTAAILVSLLRDNPASAWVTVRDIYESPTVAKLAKIAPTPGPATPVPNPIEKDRQRGRPLLVTAVQTGWLVAVFSIVSWVACLIVCDWLPRLTDALGVVPSLLLAPVLGLTALLVYTPLSVAFAVIVKRLLIGRYQPLRAPVWGGFFLRNWLVQRTVHLVPWAWLEGTAFQQAALRALGARMGRRVHLHRGVNLLDGGWDLLEIGDDVTLNQDAALRLVELDEGDIVVAPVTLGEGATLDVRAAAAGQTVLEPGAYLTALSSLPPGGRIPAGERWDGIPARHVGQAPVPPVLPANSPALSPVQHGVAMLLARAGILLLLALPLEMLAIIACLGFDLTSEQLWEWLFHPTASWLPWMVGLGIGVVAVPLTLVFQAVVMRLLGRVPTVPLHRWSLAYVRVWLKAGLVESAGEWLSGTLLWPVWLRGAGMRVGPGCEISTITDVVPEHIEIGAETFFADGIYLGGPRIQQGVVTLAMTRLGRNSFLGNHVVIPAGQHLANDVLLGICTVADDTTVRAGTSWFGLPPFELPQREVVVLERRPTHAPSWIRRANRLCWELLRFGLPITPTVVTVGWIRMLAYAETATLPMLGPAVMIPLVSGAAVGVLCLLVLALKWALLGRVRPGQHALWSCWCSRWDFLYVVWGRYAAPALSQLEGTLLLGWYLRAMGIKLGKRVVLGSGFAQVVDPDMIHIEDGATVNAMYQAHTFEDRVLKIGHVHVRRGATLGANTVPLYGAEIGEHTHVAAHSVIMKRERLLSGRRYEGAPTR